jgi:hypothetical protein
MWNLDLKKGKKGHEHKRVTIWEGNQREVRREKEGQGRRL